MAGRSNRTMTLTRHTNGRRGDTTSMIGVVLPAILKVGELELEGARLEHGVACHEWWAIAIDVVCIVSYVVGSDG